MCDKRKNLLPCVLVFVVTMAGMECAFAGKDTPDGVMAVFKEGSANSAALLTVSNEANQFLNKVATDKDYATKLLGAIQKKDIAAITSLAKMVAPYSTITVERINPDFSITISFTVKGHKVSVCGSSDKSCDGHSVTLAVD